MHIPTVKHLWDHSIPHHYSQGHMFIHDIYIEHKKMTKGALLPQFDILVNTKVLILLNCFLDKIFRDF